MSDLAAVNVSFRYNKTGRPSKTYGGEWWYKGGVQATLEYENNIKLLKVTIGTNGYVREGESMNGEVSGTMWGVIDNNQEIQFNMTEEFAKQLAKAILARLEDDTGSDFYFNRNEGVVHV